MNITVMGPGAIGCLLAAYLARSGEKIWLLDHRRERAALLARRGIAVEGERGSFHTPIRVTADPGEIGHTDLLVLCVKANQTAAAVSGLEGFLSPGSYLLSLQNGLGNVRETALVFGADRVLAGVTSHGATLLEVGRVRHAGYGEIWVGEPAGGGKQSRARERLEFLAAALNRAGLQAQLVEDINSVVWRKLVVNVAVNPLTAILRIPNGELLKKAHARKVMEEAVAEAVRVAAHMGVELALAEELERVKEVCLSTAGNISSMLQDVNHRRKTEVDQINGAVARLARELGMAAPVNEVLWALVRSIEAG